MAEIKFLAFIANLLGFSTVVTGIILNLNPIDSWKSGLVFMLSMVWLFYKIADISQDVRRKKMDNDERKWQLKKRHENDKKKP